MVLGYTLWQRRRASLDWARRKDGTWFDLNRLDLGHPALLGMEGVYVIWHRGWPMEVVRIGQGPVGERLWRQRRDPAVQAYRAQGLSVTWAAAPRSQRDGIEMYLAGRYRPRVGMRNPGTAPIPVNLPGH